MLPLTNVSSARLAARMYIGNTLLLRDVERASRINSSMMSKRFKLDYPEDPHSTQKPMDPKQTGGFGDVLLNPGLAKKIPPKTVEDFKNPDLTKFWRSYGFDEFDKRADRFFTHIHSFGFGVLVIGAFFFVQWYKQDDELNNWALREAYIEIKRREELGLPYVDCNYIPPEKVRLPTEEELEGRHVYY